MKIIGVSGQSGAGKTTALEVLRSRGAYVIDCDKVSREVMEKNTPCTKELISVFGDSIASEDGEIYRKKLGEIVFSDKEKLQTLTEITHRYIKKRIFELLDGAKEEGERFAVIDAPLLFESGLDKICDVTLAVTAPKEERIERIIKRDGITRILAEKRISSQLSENELIKRSHAVIVNDKGLLELEEKVLDFAEREGIAK
ncbi:MAG: dephospho-CoA kinase [Clostridia bacterium]|nr:dephospho-CoA kinase [Clostridia bacterium]MBQ7897772.1 dephospho-CoA kinase [Clostridia bacterium]